MRNGVSLRLNVAVLLLAGTFVGQDDDFPFGPFRMYSTRDDPDGTVVSTRVEAVDTGGTLRVVDESSTGLKRAEVEGLALLDLLRRRHFMRVHACDRCASQRLLAFEACHACGDLLPPTRPGSSRSTATRAAIRSTRA